MTATSPVLETVTTDVLEEPHTHRVVTSWAAPFDNLAVAANWAVAPIMGTVPLTVTAITAAVGEAGVDGEAVEEAPQSENAITHAARMAPSGSI
jgi:hypothetical protein